MYAIISWLIVILGLINIAVLAYRYIKGYDLVNEGPLEKLFEFYLQDVEDPYDKYGLKTILYMVTIIFTIVPYANIICLSISNGFCLVFLVGFKFFKYATAEREKNLKLRGK